MMFMKLRGPVFLAFIHRLYCFIPNIGDVRLFNVQQSDNIHSGEAQMYLTDGSSLDVWSSICKSNSFDIDAATLFCKQLGFSYEKVLSIEIGPSTPVLISNIHCPEGKKYRNLLECSHSLGKTSCSDGVFLKCKNSTSSNTLEGQLEICSPDQSESKNSTASVSFGVIGIYLKNHWRAIGNHSVSEGASNIAHLMCISMGFQRAVIGSPKRAEAFDQYTFSLCKKRYESHSWINMTDIVRSCDLEKQYPCLGCCLRYTTIPSCTTPACANDFMVIQCTFDLFEKNKKMSHQDKCTFAENSPSGATIQNYDSVCTTAKFENIGEIVLGALFAFFVVTTVAYTVGCIIYYVYISKKCHENYNQVTPNGGPNGQDK